MMNRERQIKILVIVALVVSIVGISLGFAAFSNLLKISSSATVNPNDSSFGVLFSSSNTTQINNPINGIGTNGATSEFALINGTTISGLKAYFSQPGQTVTYTFYAHNVGEYVAYLRNISFGAGKSCAAISSGTNNLLVNAACEGISVSVNVGSVQAFDDVSISNHSLGIGKYEEVVVTISYSSDGTIADEEFSISFDDILLEYSTADTAVELITFSIDGTTYNALKNMTFQEWINSGYNTAGYTTATKFYVSGSSQSLSLSTTISSNGTYTLTSSGGSSSGGGGSFVPSISIKPGPDIVV